MIYNVLLPLDEKWTIVQETIDDESGVQITHVEAHLRNDAKKQDDGMIDIYVGEMPEGETAEDQAFANYAETVGFDENDPEDYNPIVKEKFNGKNAWGFTALCEDESPMKFLAQEVRQGCLAIIVFAAPDDEKLAEVQKLIERSLRVK